MAPAAAGSAAVLLGVRAAVGRGGIMYTDSGRACKPPQHYTPCAPTEHQASRFKLVRSRPTCNAHQFWIVITSRMDDPLL